MWMSKIFAVVLAVLAGYAAAGVNQVYLDQSGNSNNVGVTQVGNDNLVSGFSGNNSSATAVGNNLVLVVEQIGNNNTTRYDLYGSNNQITSRITGNGNSSSIKVGAANQHASQVVVNESVLGSGNTSDQDIRASGVTSTVKITGSDNTVVARLHSTNGSSHIELLPQSSFNSVEVEQLDTAGATGHVTSVVLVGTSNSILVQQQGTADTVARLNITGDSNTVTVRSSSSMIVDSRTAVAR